MKTPVNLGCLKLTHAEVGGVHCLQVCYAALWHNIDVWEINGEQELVKKS